MGHSYGTRPQFAEGVEGCLGADEIRWDCKSRESLPAKQGWGKLAQVPAPMVSTLAKQAPWYAPGHTCGERTLAAAVVYRMGAACLRPSSLRLERTVALQKRACINMIWCKVNKHVDKG